MQIGSKTAVKNSAQTNRQTDRHYENNGHLAVNQNYRIFCSSSLSNRHWRRLMSYTRRYMNNAFTSHMRSS